MNAIVIYVKLLKYMVQDFTKPWHNLDRYTVTHTPHLSFINTAQPKYQNRGQGNYNYNVRRRKGNRPAISPHKFTLVRLDRGAPGSVPRGLQNRFNGAPLDHHMFRQKLALKTGFTNFIYLRNSFSMIR